MAMLRRYLRNWLPPAIVEAYSKRARSSIHFRGIFTDWAQAAAHSEGFDSEKILERVRWATHQVVSGKAACERDSVLFDRTPYPFPLIALLLSAAAETEGNLSVLDFGGSLGSSYNQCKDFLNGIRHLRWNIVEQSHYVKVGRAEFETEALRFYETVQAAANDALPNVIIASSVLQYIADPDEVIKSFMVTEAKYIFIDRTPFSLDGRLVISTQWVPSSIISSSYPLRLFNEKKFKEQLLAYYDEISAFSAIDGQVGSGSISATYKGFIFKRR